MTGTYYLTCFFKPWLLVYFMQMKVELFIRNWATGITFSLDLFSF